MNDASDVYDKDQHERHKFYRITNLHNLEINSSFLVNKMLISPEVFKCKKRRISISDFFLRHLLLLVNTSGFHSLKVHEWLESMPQFVMENDVVIVMEDGGIIIKFSKIFPDIGRISSDIQLFDDNFMGKLLSVSNGQKALLSTHWELVEDQQYLRELLSTTGAAGFVANGSILPRVSGINDRVLQDGVVPFESPESLTHKFELRHAGVILGMLLPAGLTVITGGGFHGKTTLLKALAFGVYDKIPGDGREFVVTPSSSTFIRAEDGRYVSGVNVSAFIENLPAAANILPSEFSTSAASGSTSQATNVIEAIEMNCSVLLLDEVLFSY